MRPFRLVQRQRTRHPQERPERNGVARHRMVQQNIAWPERRARKMPLFFTTLHTSENFALYRVDKRRDGNWRQDPQPRKIGRLETCVRVRDLCLQTRAVSLRRASPRPVAAPFTEDLRRPFETRAGEKFPCGLLGDAARFSPPCWWRALPRFGRRRYRPQTP